MKLVMRAVALTALPALLVSACSGGSSGANSGGQAIPAARHHALRGHDSGSGLDLHAGGATFPGQAYNLQSQPVGLASSTSQPGPGAGSLFASAGTTGTIYYCLTGSGFGRKVFDGATPANSTAPCAALGQTATGFGGAVDPPDFVGSDIALASTEYTTYKTNREPSTGTNYGEPFEFPVISGPIVYGYQRPSFPKFFKTRIRFSTWTYCAIANGTVTNWNDPAITEDNGGSVTNGVNQPILFAYRSDGSGTSYLFQNHLAAVCGSSWSPPYSKKPYQYDGRNAAWTHGFGQNWLGPTTGNFVGENGNPGVLAEIQGNPYATGYVEGAYAAAASHPTISQALLQDRNGDFGDPTNVKDVANALRSIGLASITQGEGSDFLPLATSRPDCILFINPSHFANPPTPHSYPIVGISYLLFYGNSNGVHTADRQKLVTFLTSSAANAIVNKLEYQSLKPAIQNVVYEAATGTGTYAGKPCMQ
jgi:ABC-type phosphate transport system substrate-binding protein